MTDGARGTNRSAWPLHRSQGQQQPEQDVTQLARHCGQYRMPVPRSLPVAAHHFPASPLAVVSPHFKPASAQFDKKSSAFPRVGVS